MNRIMSFCCGICAVYLCLFFSIDIYADTAIILSVNPSAMELNVKAGIVTDTAGKIIKYSDKVLSFEPPEKRELSKKVKVPADYAKWMDSWLPWPQNIAGGKVGAVSAIPKYDENGTLILGGLYKQIIPESIKVTDLNSAKVFICNKDYKVEPDWGTVAAVNGRLGEHGQGDIEITCTVNLQRLDLVQVNADGNITVKQGKSRLVCPVLPDADSGCIALAGIYIGPDSASGPWTLTAENFFPIVAVEDIMPINPAAIDGTISRLRAGKEVKIAFIGASVTLGAEAGQWWSDDSKTWRGRVMRDLKARFPKAKIKEIKAFKGGRGVEYGLQELNDTVIPEEPDLAIICMGINDNDGPVGGKAKVSVEKYKKTMNAIVKQAKADGIEVILAVSYQVNPFHPNKAADRWLDYRQAQLDIAKENNAGVADVYSEWMNLSKRGIPPYSQLHNWLNHPGVFGHKLFADVVLRFFDKDQHAESLPLVLRPKKILPPAAVEACIPGSTVIQPARIVGKWKASDTKVFPPASEIINSTGVGGLIYGLYTWSGEYKLFRKSIRKVGWRQVRFAGPFTDETMRMIAEDGIEAMPTLGIYVGGKKKTRADYDTDKDFINGTLKGLEAFLTRYGPGGTFFKNNPKLPNNPIKFIEIWNEPNFQYMIPPDGRPRIEIETAREKLYAKLLERIYPALKSQWPEVAIVGFAAGGESSGDIRFFEHVLAESKEVTKSFDIISTHPYVGSAPPEEESVRSWGSYSLPGNLAMIRDILKKNGCKKNMPIRYTELGWPISQSEGGKFPDRHKERIIPKQLQAAYVVRSYAMALRLGVERVNIMFIADSDGFNGGFFDRRDMSWRPSADAVKAMIDVMPNPKLLEVVSDGNDGYYAYKFQADVDNDSAGTVTMIWNSRKAKTIKHPATGSVTLIDMLGHKSVVKPVNGEISFHSGACPVYILDK